MCSLMYVHVEQGTRPHWIPSLQYLQNISRALHLTKGGIYKVMECSQFQYYSLDNAITCIRMIHMHWYYGVIENKLNI